MSHLRILSALVAIACALLLAGCPGQRDVPVGRVVGHVHGVRDGELTRAPLPDATVRVVGTSLTATTAADGTFAIDGVPVGPRTLTISRIGYSSAALTVAVLGGQETPAPDGVLTLTDRQWTVLVFMNADNNLETDGVDDVNEMERAPASDKMTIAVQMDRIGGYDTSNGNWTGTKRFTIVHDNNTAVMTSALPPEQGGSPFLEDLGEVNMGRPIALREFIDWGVRTFPAQHYAVIVWNHGSGWKSSPVRGPVVRGISYDDTSGKDYIRTQELPSALTAPAPLDIVAFDACLMQMIEVGYEIRHHCHYIVASEEDEPAPGYDYSTFLTPLAQNPSMTPAALADLIARKGVEIYGPNTYSTQSVVDTAKLEGVASALDTFAVALRSVAGSHRTALAAARDTAITFTDADYKDLADYALKVKARVPTPAMTAAADGVVNAVDQAVVSRYSGSVHPAARGISVYLPGWYGTFSPTDNYARNSPGYKELALSARTRWDEWLAVQVE